MFSLTLERLSHTKKNDPAVMEIWLFRFLKFPKDIINISIVCAVFSYFFRKNMLCALKPRSPHGLQLPDLLHLQEGMQQTDIPRRSVL